MGNWQLEVFRMAVYISFPVGLFYFFNQPSFFENWMMEKRERIFPAVDPNAQKIIDDYIEHLEIKQERQWIAAQQAKKASQA
ncbi:protein PET100 homolog, mitochondrial [Aplysia californica]|uniref:Protein PET100 homolog, mitochondrial n=1 Tax=Aplysia californica TaxID=6500 RepID=A0ABM1VRE7_APLCA|nr:protein PET100 homolog, mitochondrial [Aplysia californica]XP_035824989.1 protein PET100 homolog, mitochondrial [Aplysia californica]